MTANYALNNYTITATASPVAGGSVSCSPNPVPHGSNSSCTATANSGYVFTAWSGACSGSGACALSNVTSAQSVTATFTPLYPITTAIFPAAAGSITCTPNPVPSGTTASCTASINSGYRIVNISGCGGSSTSAGVTNYPTGVITAPCTVTGIYGFDSYTVNTVASPSAGGSVSCSPNPVSFGTTTTCTATANAGYSIQSIAGCSGTPTGPGITSYTTGAVNGSCTVTATFTLNTYAITATANPVAGGSLSCTPNPVPHGSNSSCTATANAGYSVQSISGCGGTATGTGVTSYTTGLVTAACTVTASFTLNNYTITATASPVAGGSVSCTPNPVPHGSNSSCTATASSGYAFTAWSGACTGSGACTLNNVTSAPSVTATFSPLYAIRTVANPAAGGNISCTPNPVTSGATASCTATLNTGYSIQSISGCGGTATGAGVTSYSTGAVTAACTVTASFALNSYAITATAAPLAGGSVTCTPNPVSHGASSSCIATANAGYAFESWSGACTGSSGCVIDNVTATQSVTANFSPTFAVSTSVAPLAGGSVSCSPNPVVSGATTSCTATPNAGYRTLRISGCGGTATAPDINAYVTAAVAATCTVEVTFGQVGCGSYIPTPVCSVDVDADGSFDITDAMMIARAMMGVDASLLRNGLADPGACVTRNTPLLLSEFVQEQLRQKPELGNFAAWDLDGDGVVNPATDGLLLLRLALGVPGATAIQGAVAPNGLRIQWPDVRSYLNTGCGWLAP